MSWLQLLSTLLLASMAAAAPTPAGNAIATGTAVASGPGATVEITFPQFSEYVGATTNETDRFLASFGPRTKAFDSQLLIGAEQAFRWVLYGPRDEEAFLQHSSPKWDMSCSVSASASVDDTAQFTLQYEAPFITGSDQSITVKCLEGKCARGTCEGYTKPVFSWVGGRAAVDYPVR
ncbi:hypothetical protein IAU60_006377 [Kwoniella sp. DSM 27419]